MITSLTMKNWRTHADTTLNFGTGTTVIVGVMGSGKSSIVNALSYALFGTFPALKGKQVSLKEIIMNKPNQMSTAETIIEFEQQGTQYRVERLIKMDGTNEAKLLENGKFISGPKQKDVNEKVEHILGMDYELFSRAVYAEQNEMDFFLKLTPSERKKKFDELLQLEKYEEARKNATTLQNELVKESKRQTVVLEQQREMLKGHEEETLTAKIHAAEKEITEYETKAHAAKAMCAELEKKYKELSTLEKRHKELTEALFKKKVQSDSLKSDIQKADGVSLTELINALSDTKNTIGILTAQKESAEKKHKEATNVLQEKREAIKVLDYKIATSEKEMKSISSLKGKCPTCKQELDEKHRSELLEAAHREMQLIIVETKKRKEEEHTLTLALKEIEHTLTENQKLLDAENKKRYTLEANEKQAQTIAGKKKLLEALLQELPALEKELTALAFDSRALENAREQYFEKKNEYDLFTAKANSLQELKKSYALTLAKIDQIKKTISSAEKESMALTTAAARMGVFGNCLIATQGELRAAMLETVNTAMTNIWSAIYPYRDFIDARLLVTSDGYDLQVQTRSGEWVRVEGILSGGERSAAALCIRIAFALVLTKNLSMLILDEPTHNLDTTAVQKLATMLREDMPTLVSQLFVITHDKELENAATNTVYVLQRNKDDDAATHIELQTAV